MTSYELVDSDLQCIGQSSKNDNCRIPRTPFDAADIGSVQARFEGQLLLGPAPFLADPLNVQPDLPPNIHPGSRPI